MLGWNWFYKFRHKNPSGEIYGYGPEAEKSQGTCFSIYFIDLTVFFDDQSLY